MAEIWRKVGCAALGPFIVLTVAIAGDSTKRATAVRTDEPPTIDGILNEDAWRKAPVIDDFVQRDPDEGEPPTERTTVRILYDDDAVYFGCFMYDSEADHIVARLTRRDNEIESDVISIFIDSFNDNQTCFEFTILASGTKVDILQYNDGVDEDDSWDPVWDVHTRLFRNGWCAEVRIPYSALRFSDGRQWGMNLRRIISRKKEETYWVMVPRSQNGFVSRFGTLAMGDDVVHPSRLEVLPYLVGRYHAEPSSALHPDGKFFGKGTGLDAKYGVSNSLTLDLTVNPDFGQVEVDPAVVNLTTFETFYPEKRPFFIEGNQILNFTTFGGTAGPGLFYSRRIGRAPPEPEIPAGGYLLDQPTSTTILGAGKLTGKTAGGLSIGVLTAVTDREIAVVVDSTNTRSDVVVEPLANYSVVRLKQDILHNSNVGMALTSVARRGDGPALTGGFDWKIRFGENQYLADGFLSGSSVPDAGRLYGSAGKFNMAKEGGEHWIWGMSWDYTSKGYQINDIGYFRRANDFGTIGKLTYKEDKSWSIVRRIRGGINNHFRWNFDKATLIREVGAGVVVTFTDYSELFAGVTTNLGRIYDDRESRTAALYEKPGYVTWAANLVTNPREPVIGVFDFHLLQDSRGGRLLDFNPDLIMRPAPNVDLTVGFRYARFSDYESFVDTVRDAGNALVSIFGDRDQEQLDMAVRGTFTFTRDLTLQVFSQVLLAKWHYKNFRSLATASIMEPATYAVNQDINYRPFNLNLVLRWEYLPGSTMYLVWTQGRAGYDQDYALSFGDSFREAFRAPGANVFLLKVSYWWSM